jgi:uridine kinase
MDILSNILHRSRKKEHLLVGICGRAGAGKTTLTNKLVKELGDKAVIYSGDWRFKQDSEERKKLFAEKWKAGIDAYMYAINQYTWWDFDRIKSDLNLLLAGEKLYIGNAYNRESGKKDTSVIIEDTNKSVIIYENCILGGVDILEMLDLIIFVNTPDEVCFSRTMQKDFARRSMAEIAGRFLITSFSENKFFNMILDKFPEKVMMCNSNGNFEASPVLRDVKQIPIFIPDTEHKKKMKGTIFCDLDGTLIKHIPVPAEDGNDIKLLPKSAEKLKEWHNKGYYIVLTSSRPYNKVFGILHKLEDCNIKFDQVICDLPVGPRHLINDSKDGELRAIVHVLERDKGVGDVEIC